MLEVPVKRILTGTPPEQAASRDSLANPALARLLRRAGGHPGRGIAPAARLAVGRPGLVAVRIELSVELEERLDDVVIELGPGTRLELGPRAMR